MPTDKAIAFLKNLDPDVREQLGSLRFPNICIGLYCPHIDDDDPESPETVSVHREGYLEDYSYLLEI